MDDSLGIAALEQLIRASATRIAPEQEDALRDLWAKEELSLEFEPDAHDLFVGVYLDSNKIVLRTRCLARLWAHVYAYCSVFKSCVQESNVCEFHAVSSGFLPAANLLVWALNDQIAANLGRPRVAPSPSAPRPDHQSGTNLERLVNEVFLCACAYLLQHEIAHVRLDHKRVSAGGQQDEFDADEGAADWILTGAATDGERTKRWLGIACALLWLYSLSVHRLLSPLSDSHPPAPLRLQAVTFPRLLDKHDPIWTFLVTAMTYHLQAVKFVYRPAQFLSPRAAVVQFVQDGLRAARGDPQLLAETPATPQVKRGGAKIKRNQRCPCGSDKKFKRCCGSKGGATRDLLAWA